RNSADKSIVHLLPAERWAGHFSEKDRLKMKISSSRAWAFIGFACAAIMFAACGSGANAPATGQTGQMAPADQQVLTLRLTGEPRTIDPQRASFAAEV